MANAGNAKQAKRARQAAFNLLVLEADLLPEISYHGLRLGKEAIPLLAADLEDLPLKQRLRAGAMAVRKIQKKRLAEKAEAALVPAEVTP